MSFWAWCCFGQREQFRLDLRAVRLGLARSMFLEVCLLPGSAQCAEPGLVLALKERFGQFVSDDTTVLWHRRYSIAAHADWRVAKGTSCAPTCCLNSGYVSTQPPVRQARSARR